MAQLMHLDGRKVPAAETVEQRRLGLLDALARKQGELAQASEQIADLTAQVHRLEGGVIEAQWLLEQLKETADETASNPPV